MRVCILVASALFALSSASLASDEGVVVQVSGGYGTLHGGLGGMVAVGPASENGDGFQQQWGIIAGIGTLEDEMLWKAGVQFGEEWFGALAYGGVGVKTEYAGGDSSTDVINGLSAVGGKYFFFSPAFLELSVGYDYGKTTFFEDTSYETDVIWSAATLDAGLGIAF